jgi:hypothetical protein
MLGALVLACAFTAACREEQRTPEACVLAYLHALGRDPLRAAELLTEDFHERHGLRVATSAQVDAWLQRELGAGPAARAVQEPRAAGPFSTRDQPAGSTRLRVIHEAQIAWLSVHLKSFYREIAARLEPRIEDVTIDGDRAEVVVALRTPQSPPFRQRFQLVRTPADLVRMPAHLVRIPAHLARGPSRLAWRIDRVEQEGVVPANLPAAFVAYPSEALRRQLAARINVSPD